MLYSLHEAAYNTATPIRMAARAARDFWGSPLNPAAASRWGRTLYASADMITNMTQRYGRPAWGIEQVTVKGCAVAVREEVVWSSAWPSSGRCTFSTSFLRNEAILMPLPSSLNSMANQSCEAFRNFSVRIITFAPDSHEFA